jgi:drug/metabolite transporter (DMT)-like permease
VPLVLAELLLGMYGLLLIALAHFFADGNRAEQTMLITMGIVIVAIAVLLVGLTNLLIRYIAKPCERTATAILPS